MLTFVSDVDDLLAMCHEKEGSLAFAQLDLLTRLGKCSVHLATCFIPLLFAHFCFYCMLDHG